MNVIIHSIRYTVRKWSAPRVVWNFDTRGRLPTPPRHHSPFFHRHSRGADVARPFFFRNKNRFARESVAKVAPTSFERFLIHNFCQKIGRSAIQIQKPRKRWYTRLCTFVTLIYLIRRTRVATVFLQNRTRTRLLAWFFSFYSNFKFDFLAII